MEWTTWEEAVAEIRHNWMERPEPPAERLPTLQEVFSTGEDYSSNFEGSLEGAVRILRALGAECPQGFTAEKADALAVRIGKMKPGREFEKSYRIGWTDDGPAEIYLNILKVEPDLVQMSIHCGDKDLHAAIEALTLVEG